MSIIYDALKKVEGSNNLNTTVQAGKTDKPRRRFFLIYILVAGLGIFIASLFFGLLTKPFQADTQHLASKEEEQIETTKDATVLSGQVLKDSSDSTNTAVEPKKQPAVTLLLNGIFFSGNEGYALINNQILKEGDTIIEGTVVKRIAFDEVEVEAEGSILKLYPDR